MTYHDEKYYSAMLKSLHQSLEVKRRDDETSTSSTIKDTSSPFYYIQSTRAMAVLMGELNIKNKSQPPPTSTKEEHRIKFLSEKEAKATRSNDVKSMLHSIRMMKRGRTTSQDKYCPSLLP